MFIPSKGLVYLVGAGPGRPDLLTLRGAECLRRADVVVVDALVDRRALAHCRPGTQVVDAGKRGDGSVRLRQPNINRLLVRLARLGKTVVRLKGGDPYFFGRGAEEAEALADAKIPFEVVPGVSAATSVPGFAGVPLTHRGHASVVTVVTGHEGRENPYLGESPGQALRRRGPGVDWARISPTGTLVILMGVRQLSAITRRLLSLGWPSSLPVAVIQWGSWAGQKTVHSTLADIARHVKQQRLGAPAVIVVGEVAAKGSVLNWFEQRPLFGKTVLVTRAREQASSLTALLEESGARVIESPTIAIHPLPLEKKGRDYLQNISRYDGILISSANAARYFSAHLHRSVTDDSGDPIGTFGSPISPASRGGKIEKRPAVNSGGRSLPPIFALGEKTAAALGKEGLPVRAVAQTFQSEGLLKLLGKNVRGRPYLFPRAREGRDVIESSLRRRGARVDLWPLYETRPIPLPALTRREILASRVDAVAFASSSTVKGFLKGFTPSQQKKIFATVGAFSIGPITSATLRGAGWKPVTASRSTVEDLARCVAQGFRLGGKRQQ